MGHVPSLSVWQAHQASVGQVYHREGLVDLEEVDIRQAQAGSVQGLCM